MIVSLFHSFQKYGVGVQPTLPICTMFHFISAYNQTKDIFHLKFPILKIPRLLTIEDPVKTLSVWARLWIALNTRFHFAQILFILSAANLIVFWWVQVK